MLFGKQRRGFTLVEVLVVIGIIALLLGILIPMISRVRERNNRTKCMANLRRIGQALLAYSTENRSHYPRIRWEPGDNPDFLLGGFVPANASTPFVPKNDANYDAFKNDSHAGFFLLIRSGAVSADAFICPSTEDVVDTFDGASPQDRSNFSQFSFSAPVRTVSYTYACLYPDKAAMANGFKALASQVGPDYALVADYSLPRCIQGNDSLGSNGRPGNSRNHRKQGQNVLYSDGRVVWQETNRCGPRGTRPAGAGEAVDEADNIYTSHRNNSCNQQSPDSALDSVLQE
jgi:prepilin-type N-terminal cleavage/methylation domain-containing protein